MIHSIKKVLIATAVLFSSAISFAQQDPQYTQYMYNMNLVNPAYAGSEDMLSLNFLARAQWVGIKGAPRTITFNAHAPVGRKVGLGFSAFSDELGPVKEQNVYADFSYTLKVNEKANLALGLKAGFSFFKANLSDLITNNPDPAFLDNNINRTLPNFGFGAFYYTEKLYVGASIPNVLKTVHFKKSNGQRSTATNVSHYFITGGMVFNLSETVKMKPSFMAKVVSGAPLSADGSLNFLFNEKFELGISHRINESFSGLVNFRVNNKLRLGYAYDHTLTALGDFNSGSHEVFVLFNFDFQDDKIKSPRFF